MAEIRQFKERFIGGGTRPNQFRVRLTFPDGVDISGQSGTGANRLANLGNNRISDTLTSSFKNIALRDGEFLIKSASLPSSNIQDIAVPFRGRTTHLAGERTFQPWTISVYNATNFAIRNAMEQWSTFIQHHTNTEGEVNPNLYTTDIYLDQLNRDDTVLKTYVLHNAYPSDLGALPNDFDAQNQLQIFDVQFQYDFWTTDAIANQDEPARGRDGFGFTTQINTPVGNINLIGG